MDIIFILLVFFAIALIGYILGGFIAHLLLSYYNESYEVLSYGTRLFFVITGSFLWGLCILSIWFSWGQSVIFSTGFLGLSLLAIPPYYCFNKASQLEREERLRQEQLAKEEEEKRIRAERRRIRAERFEKEQIAKGLVKFVDRHGKKKWGTPEQVNEWKKIDIGMKGDFKDLSPREFEEFIANLFTRMGFQTEVTSYVKDHGADILAERERRDMGRERVVIQVKKYEPRHHVGSREVRDVLGSMGYFKATKAVLVTTSDFTIDAQEQAKGEPIELWNREKLYRMIDRYILSEGSTSTKVIKSESAFTTGDSKLGKCDVCGKEVPKGELLECGECGKAYCKECADKSPKTIKELGVCPDCEETYEAEEDYWGWGEEEEW